MRPLRSILIDNNALDAAPGVVPSAQPPVASEPAQGPFQGIPPEHPIWAKLAQYYIDHPEYDPEKGKPPQTADETAALTDPFMAELSKLVDEKIVKPMAEHYFGQSLPEVKFEPTNSSGAGQGWPDPGTLDFHTEVVPPESVAAVNDFTRTSQREQEFIRRLFPPAGN
jgi:hypothetical protein